MKAFAARASAGRVPTAVDAEELFALCRLSPEAACRRLHSSADGLTAEEAARRLAYYGANRIAHERQPSVLEEIWNRAKNPLNALLLGLAAVSGWLGDMRAAIVIAVMVTLAVATAFLQEHRSNAAAARLRAMVRTTASVRRSDAGKSGFAEIALEELVPGDIVRLSAGDMIPAELRLIEAKDLFVNQSALTGEAMPVEKFAHACEQRIDGPFDLPNVCFMGANVVSGYGTGVVIRTGERTFFGQLARDLAGRRAASAFDRGIARFVLLMIRFMLVMASLVFLINGVTKGDWLEALLFAVAVAVGLTPEMLPMIVMVNLAEGAIAMARARVIVKQLGAIQNFGAMDVLCTDKTGTLTENRVALKRHVDVDGRESERVLQYAWLNSYFQSGLKNLLDVAVLEHAEMHRLFGADSGWSKVDEIPFDFSRRRLSVVLARPSGGHVLICKGAVEEIFAVCSRYESNGSIAELDPSHSTVAKEETAALNESGFRVVAVAYKEIDPPKAAYSTADESDLTLLGYIAFLDPPKESAAQAIAALAAKGVQIKILTGDNEIITRKVCCEVGLDTGEILLGSTIERMDDEQLAEATERTTVFAKLAPAQKERIVALLHRRGHVVGFLGDGINDSPALKAADVGISVDGAVDIARESADVILLEKNLLVLREGVIEGRKVFANIVKYIRMGASSNFGNTLSVIGASLFLPFLPMAPIQILTNNLLYDFSQAAIPTDSVDEDYVAAPRRWDISGIFRFMVLIGPVSSLFDYATFGVMIFVFGAWTNPPLFQTGWFVESLLTQTLIIHVIRTAKVPFVQSHASAALLVTTTVIAIVGILLPYSGIGNALGFVPLPGPYWPLVAAILLSYGLLAHGAKTWYVKRWGM